MTRRRNRQRSFYTDVWLSKEVLRALEELSNFYGPRRGRTARFFLIQLIESDRFGKEKSHTWERENINLTARPKNQCLVRMPLRIFQKLLEAIDAKATELHLSRSALLRQGLTAAVDERVEMRFPSLVKTLAARNLPRNPWPWEE
jgi:hypothetical protein